MSESAENICIESGLDRQTLNLIKKRFTHINRQRLLRLRSVLNKHQQLVIQSLPLLFHSNHPVLPGYVSQHSPARLARFNPDEEQLRIGRLLARSFNFRPDARPPDILGIYVMGSVGTIAQNGGSDLDIWLCHRPDIDTQKRCELAKKCERISAWASKAHLEMHFFPMDARAFRDGDRLSMDSESSGSTQQLFLLDEFYRSAIHLGGRLPLWWFVPPQNEQQYNGHVHTLLQRGFLRSEDLLDFGGLDNLVDSEYISAGIWQLYKAIESPYKSIIKLLLLEAYASEQPNITPLALSFKQLVYQGILDIDQLDSYLLSYQRIEQYLVNSQQNNRLDLARRCFYFKVNRALSKPVKQAHCAWQRDAIQHLVEQWRWSQQKLVQLDNRARWRAIEVSQERNALVAELNRCYQFLLDAANTSRASRRLSGEELKVLGRKLQAAFERRPGKIEWLNPNISKDLSEKALSLKRVYYDADQDKPATWLAVSLENGGQDTLYSATILAELLIWCYFNGICDSNTYFDLDDCSLINSQELRKLLSVFKSWLPQPQQSSKHCEFQQTARPTQLLLLVNFALQPTQDTNNGSRHLDADVDALCDPRSGNSLIQSLDLLSFNSWNELCCKRFEGDNALLEAISNYLQQCTPESEQQPPPLRIEYFGDIQALSVAHRVRHLFAGINRSCFPQANPSASRFIFKLNRQYHCLQPYPNSVETRSFTDKKFLMDYLSLAQTYPSKIILDSKTLQRDPLEAIFSRLNPPTISVIYQRFDFGWELFVAGEQGALQQFVLRGSPDFNPLVSLHHFLRNVLKRENLASNSRPPDFGVKTIEFYELIPSPADGFSCQRRSVPSESKASCSFALTANGHLDNNEQIVFDFYCDDQSFSATSLGEQLYTVVAQSILSRRQSGENYPVYLTDLDLNLCRKRLCKTGYLQTSHYLHYKKTIEQNLNQCLGRVLHG
ncbi:MAG: class I adenylate cyclase [Cellvibrionaceae bacterium]|nr:class I adenylate cyclase [Cellvibrionaceae bacterium]